MAVVNKIIHRFIRDRKDYEQGGELYGQIIPYNVQAYSYTLKENGDINNPNDYIVKYVLGTGSSTYLEIAEGRGRDLENQHVPELSKELLVSSQDQLEDIINAIFDYDGVKYTLNIGEDLHKTIDLLKNNTISITNNDNELVEVFGYNVDTNTLDIGELNTKVNIDTFDGKLTINEEKTVATEESVADVYLTKHDAEDTYATIVSLNAHLIDKDNPHEVTKTQVGLGNVDNTSDQDKPVSIAQQSALDLKADKATTYTKTEVDGLITVETERAKTAEQNLQKLIEDEALTRESSDTTITNNLNSEAEARKAGDNALTEITNSLRSDLTAEVNRATVKENELNTSITNVSTRVTTVENKIPEQASITNQLADKAFVNSSIQTAASNFRGSWNTFADVPTDAELYPVDYAGIRKPSTNDYLIVQNASDYFISFAKNKLDTSISSTWVKNTPTEPLIIDFESWYKGITSTGYLDNSIPNMSTPVAGTIKFNNTGESLDYGVGAFLELLPNEKYTLSSKSQGKAAIVGYTTVNGIDYLYSSVITEKKDLPITFTTDNSSAFGIIFYADELNVEKVFEEIQLEKGSVATAYEPASDISTIKGTWRFKYVGNWDIENKDGWLAEYRVNEDPLTQAQVEAINSGITQELVRGDSNSILANSNNIEILTEGLSELKENYESHVTNFENPHKVTKLQLGLENVDNTSDANKPISDATQFALGLKADRLINGTPNNILVVADNKNDYKDSAKAFTTSVAETESDSNILTGLAVKTYVDAQVDTRQHKFNTTAPLVLTNDNLSINTYKGASNSTAGVAGIVPSGTAGENNRFFCVDGTWRVVPHPVRREIDLSSQLNGTKSVFTLDVDIGNDYDIYYNGVHQRLTKNFTLEGRVLNLLITPPAAGEDLLIVYRK
jgi:hypothetical protein